MGVKVNEVLEKIFMLEDKISEITDEFIDYLENDSYFIKLKSDILEGEEFLTIKIEIPGIEKEDIKIYKKENNLIIKGVKRKEYNEEKVEFILAERRFGSFYNIFPIPVDFNLENIETKIKNGVLIIKIPRKSAASVIQKIEIE